MHNFDIALKQVLKYEGKYSNNPKDSGGETIYGISRKWYPKWVGWKLVDRGIHEGADIDILVSKFYKEIYWDKLHLDHIVDINIAGTLFNFSVNIGKRKLVMKVQRILGTTIDGVIGPITLKLLNGVNPKEFLYHLFLELIEFYLTLAKNPQQREFLVGWINRVINSYYLFENG